MSMSFKSILSTWLITEQLNCFFFFIIHTFHYLIFSGTNIQKILILSKFQPIFV